MHPRGVTPAYLAKTMRALTLQTVGNSDISFFGGSWNVLEWSNWGNQHSASWRSWFWGTWDSRSIPASAMHTFHKCVQPLSGDLILSPAQPLGKVSAQRKPCMERAPALFEQIRLCWIFFIQMHHNSYLTRIHKLKRVTEVQIHTRICSRKCLRSQSCPNHSPERQC